MRKISLVLAAAVLLAASAPAQNAGPNQNIVFVQHDADVVINASLPTNAKRTKTAEITGRMARNERMNTLAVMNADGTGVKELKVQGNEPALSPDGSKIAFSRAPGNDSPQIFVVNADGKELKQLTDFKDQLAADPAWSPDGKKIVFALFRVPKPRRSPDLYLMNADGSNRLRIVESGAAPSFSPDGSRIVFASRRDGNFEIYSARADGSDLRRLTNHRAEDSNPAWSPDGSTIAFVSDRDGDRHAIYVMNPDGTDVQRLAFSRRQEFCFPAWTPDSKSVLFTTVNVAGAQIVDSGEDRPRCEQWAGEYQIYSIDLDGTHVKMLSGTKQRGFHASMGR